MAEIIPFTSYNLNPLMRFVLITNTEVIFHSPTKQTFDPRLIQQSIIIAEERFIRPALGNALYNDMLLAKNVVVTDDNRAMLQGNFPAGIVLVAGNIVNSFDLMVQPYKDLWLTILWKLVSECVGLTAYPDAWIQFGAEGLVHNAPSSKMLFEAAGVSVPDLASIKFAMDKKMSDRIAPLLESLHYYIVSNKANYPLYDKFPVNANMDEAALQKRSNFVLGLYDDVDRRNDRGCGCRYNKNDYYTGYED